MKFQALRTLIGAAIFEAVSRMGLALSINPGPAVTNTPTTQAVLAGKNTNPATGNQYTPYQGQNAFRLLAGAQGVNMNALGDTVLPIINASAWSIFQVVMTNASISLTTAAAGLFTAPAAGGTAIVANAALTALTGPTIVSQRTVASTTRQTGSNVYFNIATAQGAAATAEVYVFGFDLSPIVTP